MFSLYTLKQLTGVCYRHVSAALKVLMKGVQSNEAAADEEELEELVRAFCLPYFTIRTYLSRSYQLIKAKEEQDKIWAEKAKSGKGVKAKVIYTSAVRFPFLLILVSIGQR